MHSFISKKISFHFKTYFTSLLTQLLYKAFKAQFYPMAL